MSPNRAVAVAAGLLVDRALGEPPAPWHPVARFGTAMTRLEQVSWSDRRSSGAAFATAGTVGAAAIGAALQAVAPASAAVASTTYIAVAGRALQQAAAHVADALRHEDLPEARPRLRSLVGRRTDGLGETEIVRAVVESVAENTVDAVVAPAFWALAAGAPGVLGYRAINTMDAMVGHHTPRYELFGWASARADDAANWVPARLTALLVAAIRPSRARAVLHAVRTQAPTHPSPNAGVAEAAFAGALGIRLGGVNDYHGRVEERPVLGAGRPPGRADIDGACRLSRDVTVAFATAGLCAMAGRRFRAPGDA